MLICLALLVRMIKSEPGVATLVDCVTRPAAVGLLLLWTERGAPGGASGRRVLTLLRLALPFVLLWAALALAGTGGVGWVLLAGIVLGVIQSVSVAIQPSAAL